MRQAAKKKENDHQQVTTPAATLSGPRSAEKASTGVGGLDHLLRGGLPAHRIHLVEGHPGSGKTTLGLQFLLEGVKHGESCMYITLSETAEELRANAASHGWDLSGIHIQEFNLPRTSSPRSSTRCSIPSEIESVIYRGTYSRPLRSFKPARAVLDSVSDMRLLAETRSATAARFSA
jgi:circadian clock protein KaiC